MTAILAEEENQVRQLDLTFLCCDGVRAFDEQRAIFAKRLCRDAILQIRENILQPLLRMVDDQARLCVLPEPVLLQDLLDDGGDTIHKE